MKTKNIFKATLVALMIFAMASFTNVANAQVLFSGGVEVALPLAPEFFTDIASLGAGVSLGAEYEATDNISVDAQVGYINMFLKDEADGFVDSYALIPAQLGGRYYFTGVGEGLYARATVGIHNVAVDPGDGSTELSYGAGIGAWVNEMIDVALRYNIVSGDSDDLGYVGVRAAYTFNR